MGGVKEMEFVRLGGLSPVKHLRINKAEEADFHYPPPTKKGIYAFIYPYIDPFLYSWKLSNILKNKYGKEIYDSPEYNKLYNKLLRSIKFRRFNYEGYLWTHIGERFAVDKIGYFYKVHTNYLDGALKKYKKVCVKNLFSDHMNINTKIIKDPFKTGQFGFCGKECLEIYIDGKDCNKIK